MAFFQLNAFSTGKPTPNLIQQASVEVLPIETHKINTEELKPAADVEMDEELPLFWVIGFSNKVAVFNESWEQVAEQQGKFSKVCLVSDKMLALVEMN